jgi:hypothetical protein
VHRGERDRVGMCMLAASIISAVDDSVLLFGFRAGVSEAMRRPCVYKGKGC